METTHRFIRWNLRVDDCWCWSWTIVERFLKKCRRRIDFIDEDDRGGTEERMDESAGTRH